MIGNVKFLCIIIILSPIFLIYGQFAGGNGTFEDPWLIRTPENLDSLRYYLGSEHADKYFKQIEDIDLGISPWNEGEGWEPVGTITDSMFFQSKYDGSGKIIRNLTINKPDSNYIGLFGAVHDAYLENIGIVNAQITGNFNVGCLAGFNWNFAGLISNCYSTGNIVCNSSGGGLVGSYALYMYGFYSLEGLRITDSYSRCNVTGSSSVAGIVGYCGLFSSITNSYSTGKITDIEGDMVPGFIDGAVYTGFGKNYWDIETSGCAVSDLSDKEVAKGKTTYEMTHYGPDIYFDWDFNDIWAEDIYGINDGYPILQIQLPENVPEMPEITSVEVNDLDFHVYWNNPSLTRTGEILTGLDRIYITRDGVLIHTIESPSIGSSADFAETLAEPGYYTYRIYGENSSGLGILAKTSQIVGQMFSGGSGTETDPYLIGNPDDLNNIRYITGYLNVKNYFQQISDIDINVAPWNSGEYWKPIKYFTDIYNGNDFSIDNLTIVRPEENNLGLFSETEDALIRNLKFNSAGIIGGNNAGTVAGYAENSTFNNINISVMMTGENNVGGLVGELHTGSIVNCSVTGEITGNIFIGGITGTLYGSINDSNSETTIYCGSIAGGLAGDIEFSSIYRSCSNCSIYSSGNIIGGLIGRSHSSDLEENYSKGYIEGNEYLGGILGEDQEFTDFINCYSFTEVHSTDSDPWYGLGGLAGSLPFLSDVTNCYSIGNVSDSDNNYNHGGLIGDSGNLYLYNSYWDIETSGQETSDGGEGRTTSEMTNPDLDQTYVSWDFTDVWKIDPLLNGGYPYLSWQNLSGIEDGQVSVPDEFTLYQNYPNPFNPVTIISYTLPLGYSGNVKLTVYNANGQMIRELVNGKQNSGRYSVEFNSYGLNSGMYFYNLKTDNTVLSKKMLLLK
ncbi:MAG: T9SS type A sorting domain-containing protein [Candidatus Delongbacteria bacterium]|nr:T9SS type A sorting domain-containing protein [Candidatus Delongbacteria bacterium]